MDEWDEKGDCPLGAIPRSECIRILEKLIPNGRGREVTVEHGGKLLTICTGDDCGQERLGISLTELRRMLRLAHDSDADNFWWGYVEDDNLVLITSGTDG